MTFLFSFNLIRIDKLDFPNQMSEIKCDDLFVANQTVQSYSLGFKTNICSPPLANNHFLDTAGRPLRGGRWTQIPKGTSYPELNLIINMTLNYPVSNRVKEWILQEEEGRVLVFHCGIVADPTPLITWSVLSQLLVAKLKTNMFPT